jgi:hypothetical protein
MRGDQRHLADRDTECARGQFVGFATGLERPHRIGRQDRVKAVGQSRVGELRPLDILRRFDSAASW